MPQKHAERNILQKQVRGYDESANKHISNYPKENEETMRQRNAVYHERVNVNAKNLWQVVYVL
jgi:hypothetical protein